MREFRDLMVVLGMAALAVSPLLHPKPEDATTGGIFRLGLAAVAVALVIYVGSLLSRVGFVRHSFVKSSLEISVGNSGEFDKLDVAEPPREWSEEAASTARRLGQEPTDNWVRFRKTIKVTNGSRTREAKGCKAAVTEIEPHASQDTLPARLLWNNTNAETCDIPPGGHAYVVVWEMFQAMGGHAKIRNQRPLVSLTLEECAEVRIVVWNEEGARPDAARLRLAGLPGAAGFPVVELLPASLLHRFHHRPKPVA